MSVSAQHASVCRRQPGFFSPDKFTFGTFFGAQQSRGRRSVGLWSGGRALHYLSPTRTAPHVRNDAGYGTHGSNQILRVDNDPSRPEAGSIKVEVEGGK